MSTPAAATPPSANQQRILVVDDESSISDLIATSLRFVGFDVRTAATGSEALTIAEEFKPHALILDVMLPDQDGFEVCRQLRQDGHSVGAKSIASLTSGSASETDFPASRDMVAIAIARCSCITTAALKRISRRVAA